MAIRQNEQSQKGQNVLFETLTSYLENVTPGRRDSFMEEITAVVSFNKNTSKRLGSQLRAVKPTLKKARIWFQFVDAVADITGYSHKTILRWADDDEAKTSPKSPKPTNHHKELTSIVRKMRDEGELTKDNAVELASEVIFKVADGVVSDKQLSAYLQKVIVHAAKHFNVDIDVTITPKKVTR